MNLWADFLTNDARLIHKWKHYFPIYERHFGAFVYKPLTFLEIGCGEGGSLQMWKRYFGPHATILGVDIRPECKNYEEDQIEVRIGPQQDLEFLKTLIEEFGTPDIVLDDGSHMMSHMVATFEFLYPRVAKNGVYMVEDLHAAYWDEYGGGYLRRGTFIELCKNLIDELNADHARGALAATEFTNTTLAMHLYDSVAVFERGSNTKKWAPKIGRADHDGRDQTVSSHGQNAEAIKLQSGTRSAASTQLQEAIAARNNAERALVGSRELLAAAQASLAQMQNSVSWKVTEPARKLMSVLRSGPRKARADHES
jgi:hypothetical protein